MAITKGSDPLLRVTNDDKFIAPATHSIAVTPSDTVELTNYSRGLFVGTSGNVAVTLARDGDPAAAGVVFKNVPSGTLLPIRCRQVWSTNTTATDIVAVW